MCRIEKVYFNKTVRPMKTTFATALGSKNCATSVIVHVLLQSGQTGTGEVPTSFVVKNETVPAIKEILTLAKKRLIGTSVNNYSEMIEEFRRRWPDFNMTISGLETAVFRAWLANRNKSEYSHWGARLDTLETDITIPFVLKQTILTQWLESAIKKGFKKYKIKVSGNITRDIKFVQHINRTLTNKVPDFTIRLDGNQGFTLHSSLKMLDKLEKAKIKIELFEQPLLRNNYIGLKNLYKRSSIPIIADETVFTPDDCKKVIDENLAHGVNIKIAKSGIARSAEIFRLAKKARLKVMLGCMTETITGLSAAVYFAAGKGTFDYIDLDSIHFLHHFNRYNDLTISGSTYKIGTKRK